MCGIAGIYSNVEIERNSLVSMTSRLSHRGPDAQAVYLNDSGNLGLGHTRLSIIDLSSSANQPMTSSDGRFVIVFNGEIYNYREVRDKLRNIDPSFKLRTNSDTEVILWAYTLKRESMLEMLNGMFALAIYDNVEQTLFLCRDRIGKKPLYYFASDKYFIFASELKSLLKHPSVRENRELDMNSLFQFLNVGYISEPNTIYSAIKKFPAGHYCTINHRLDFSFVQYWNLDEVANKIRHMSNVRSALLSRLEDAVSLRMISDVPVGTFLSGGTDSSLITAVASRFASEKLKTFNISFESEQFDESGYARKVAKQLGTDHHELRLTEQDAMALVDTYTRHFDEPFADASAVPTMLVSSFARKHVTVALTGDGGDELFLGYGAYQWAERLKPSLKQKVLQSGLQLLKFFPHQRLKRIATLSDSAPGNLLRPHIFSQEHYFFSQRQINDELLRSEHHYIPFGYDDLHHGRSAMERQALFDIKYYLKDDLLVKVDRASMFYGLECRSPFLDRFMIELALSIPQQYKVKGGVTKWILKELLRQYLPDELVFRKKWGFSIPLERWLKGDLKYLVDQYLNEQMVTEIGIFNYHYIKSLCHSFFSTENSYLYNRIWVLVLAHKWLKENG